MLSLLALTALLVADQKPLVSSNIQDCAEGTNEDIKTPVSLPKPTS